MTMKDLIDKLKTQKSPVDGRLVQRRDRYIQSVEQLIANIQKWLEPAVRDHVMKLTTDAIEVTEEDLGTYRVQDLTIEIIDREGATVRIEPKGVLTVGMVGGRNKRLTNLRGRVELSCGPFKVPIGLTDEGVWMAVTLRGDLCELNEQTFADMLSEVLLDG